jgi:hypothetical protein
MVALVAAACGSAGEKAGNPGSSEPAAKTSSGAETVQTTLPAETVPAEEDPLAGKLQPPAILLMYRGQEQEAVRGSYCVDYVDEASGQGSGVCADAGAPTYPDAATSVESRDRVTFVLRGATFEHESVVTIRPFGCADRETDTIVLEPGSGEHTWAVDLAWGAYQLDVLARFTAKDGRQGDVSGSLGLTVAGPKRWDALGVGDVHRSMWVCPSGA